jgi:RNA methyltransferase, TrmH family
MNAPRQVTSLQNDTIKSIRALQMRKERKETGLFVAEGASLLITARDRGFKPETFIYLAGSADSGVTKGLVTWALDSGTEVLEVTEQVLSKIASKDNPQTVIATFRQRWAELPQTQKLKSDAAWIALEEVRDPGNLGTIIRTADAVGAQGIILVGQCCDPYALDAIRATMGSIFSVPTVKCSRDAFLAWRKSWPGDVVGTHLDGSEDFRKVSYRAPVLLVMGSEGPGLSPEMTTACSRLVKIPMAGNLDSLNLAIATALTLYQIRSPHLKL